MFSHCPLLPRAIVAANGFDVFSHAVESLTARPFSHRPAPEDPAKRPLGQGANPYSDIACLEAIKLIGANLVEAVNDAGGTDLADAGDLLAGRVIEMMRRTGIPNGLGGVGYSEDDLEALTDRAFPQKRLLVNAPLEPDRDQLKDLFRDTLGYW